MKLFKRYIGLIIEIGNKQITVNDIKENRENDLRITFNVEKSKHKNPNSSTIQVYNLNKETRDMLDKNNIHIFLNAGYTEGYETLIKSDVTNIDHKFQGQDWISTFYTAESFISIKSSTSSQAFKKDEKLEDAIKALGKDMGLEFDGLVKNVTLKSKEILAGSSATALEELMEAYELEYHISNGKIKIFDNKLQRKDAHVICSDTGLLKEKGVVKTDVGVNIRTILNPTINAGDTIYLDASYISENAVKTASFIKEDMSLENLNGYYNVSNAKFIGDNYGSDYVVELECLNGI